MRFETTPVTGAYTQRIFRDELGMSADSLVNSVPKEDFGGYARTDTFLR